MAAVRRLMTNSRRLLNFSNAKVTTSPPFHPSFSTAVMLHSARVTEPAPDFRGTAVVDGGFKEISLSDYAGNTFVCPTEITSFSDKASEFEALDTSLIAVSTDSQFSHLAWTNTPRNKGGLGKVDIPLLSDFCKNMSRDYGVLLENAGIALRGLFIIDGNGIVRHSSVNDLPVGRSVEETLRLVQAFQFTDRHGEVCPASWSPGEKTIKPDVEDADEYFSTIN